MNEKDTCNFFAPLSLSLSPSPPITFYTHTNLWKATLMQCRAIRLDENSTDFEVKMTNLEPVKIIYQFDYILVHQRSYCLL